ncbi:hypothetical protein MRX96_004685 [Rhipicephalus microplus]
MGIITAVATSDYVMPVVLVVKRDGGIRICGDYKVTVNPGLGVTRFPLPKVDDLFAALSGGMHFSKIDLNRTYQEEALVIHGGKACRERVNHVDGCYWAQRNGTSTQDIAQTKCYMTNRSGLDRVAAQPPSPQSAPGRER